MKILCYNKGTKEKETNKKCFNLTKKEKHRCMAKTADEGVLAKGS